MQKAPAINGSFFLFDVMWCTPYPSIDKANFNKLS